MALASLRFQRNAQDYEESRQGVTVFAGDAASFHEWQFRLQIKKSLCTAEELPALTAKVVDALRGEALSCAMEIGLAKLRQMDLTFSCKKCRNGFFRSEQRKLVSC